MKRSVTPLLAILVLTCAPVASMAQDKAASGGKGEAQKPQMKEMNTLTAKAFDTAFQAIGKANHFYPFALYIEDGEMKSMAWDMQSGKKPPKARKWIQHLFAKLREKARKSDKMTTASVARLHHVEGKKKGKDGKQSKGVLGVWVLTDHREANPVVSFLPLIKKDNGKYKPGNMIYQGTDNWIFKGSRGNRED